MEGVSTTEETIVLEAAEDVVVKVEETVKEVVEAVDPLSLITTAVHMVCVTTKVPISEPLQMATKIMWSLIIEWQATIASAPDRLGCYLLVIKI